jgi:DNA-directed RNA polymerase specialized sigma24 family protein
VRDEPAGFAEFYEANKDACLRAVAAGVADRSMAEDFVAEAFARAWGSWATVARHPFPAAWVVRTALNVRVSWWRRHRRELPLAGHDGVITGSSEYTLEPGLLAALSRLPTRQREVVALRLLLDMDTKSTAEALGIAPGTVTAHLTRALTSLRSHLRAPAPTTTPPR